MDFQLLRMFVCLFFLQIDLENSVMNLRFWIMCLRLNYMIVFLRYEHGYLKPHYFIMKRDWNIKTSSPYGSCFGAGLWVLEF